jgi:hypothetical protein
LLGELLVVVKRYRLLNVRWDAGTRWRLRRDIANAEAMGLRDRAMEGPDLLEAPANMLAGSQGL